MSKTKETRIGPFHAVFDEISSIVDRFEPGETKLLLKMAFVRDFADGYEAVKEGLKRKKRKKKE